MLLCGGYTLLGGFYALLGGFYALLGGFCYGLAGCENLGTSGFLAGMFYPIYCLYLGCPGAGPGCLAFCTACCLAGCFYCTGP